MAEARLERALVFVGGAQAGGEEAFDDEIFALPFSLDAPGFDGDVLFARDRGLRNQVLARRHPGRIPYLYRYDPLRGEGRLAPLEASALPATSGGEAGR